VQTGSRAELGFVPRAAEIGWRRTTDYAASFEASTDLVLRLGVSIARAWCVRELVAESAAEASLEQIDESIEGIANQMYPSGVPSLEGSCGPVTVGGGSRGHARAQESGAMVCHPRRAVGVWRASRIVLPPTGNPSLDVVLVAVEARRIAA
jgi:hypothetical protein